MLAEPLLLHCSHVVLTVGAGVPCQVPGVILNNVPTTGEAPILRSEVILALVDRTNVALPLTGEAGKKLALPGWLAVIWHVPAARIVIKLPFVEQTDRVETVYVTGRPEVAVAPGLNADDPT